MSALIHKYKLLTQIAPQSAAAEAYRILRTNIQFTSLGQEMKLIAVTSAYAGEGKSTTIGNLAIAYAQADKKVMLVDTDLRSPSLHLFFAVPNRKGVTALLADQCRLEEAVHEELIPNLSLLTAGPPAPNPAELLGSHRMDLLLDKLRETYDIVLLDSSPALPVSDALILSAKCDGVLFVVKAGQVKRQAAAKALAQLEQVKAKVLGVVLNGQSRHKGTGA